jgi:SAM-dependent methyltransferase
LDVARELFDERRPLIASPSMDVRTVWTDGRTIPLADNSADRIICHDAFHHIPNPAEVLREFQRVLKEGGLACFSEPGRYHSSKARSQREMVNYHVLENDIVVEDLWRFAQAAGFTDITLRPVLDLSYVVTLGQYLSIVRNGRVGFGGREALMNGTIASSIVFLHKGMTIFDSRFPGHLSARLEVSAIPITAATGRPVKLSIGCTNTGQATWLSNTSDRQGIGQVNVGIELCDRVGYILERDWRRVPLPHDVMPGESVDVQCELLWTEVGQIGLRFDLVSEGVAWFNATSEPELVTITIT